MLAFSFVSVIVMKPRNKKVCLRSKVSIGYYGPTAIRQLHVYAEGMQTDRGGAGISYKKRIRR